MGTFLSMSAVKGASAPAVVEALKGFAEARGGRFEPASLEPADYEACVIRELDGNTTVRYPHGFMEWDDAAQHLSQALQAPVFSFHIHDSDFWMYILFVNGQPVDQFLPVPDYWESEPDEAELNAWKGSAAVVAQFAGIPESAVARYLVRWDEDMEGKAYEDDEYGYEDWQLTDFIRRLGLASPFDAEGEFAGDVYRLEV